MLEEEEKEMREEMRRGNLEMEWTCLRGGGGKGSDKRNKGKKRALKQEEKVSEKENKRRKAELQKWKIRSTFFEGINTTTGKIHHTYEYSIYSVQASKPCSIKSLGDLVRTKRLLV